MFRGPSLVSAQGLKNVRDGSIIPCFFFYVYVTDDDPLTPKTHAKIPAPDYLFWSKYPGFLEIIRDYHKALRSLEKPNTLSPKNLGQLTQESHSGVPKQKIKKTKYEFKSPRFKPPRQSNNKIKSQPGIFLSKKDSPTRRSPGLLEHPVC